MEIDRGSIVGNDTFGNKNDKFNRFELKKHRETVFIAVLTRFVSIYRRFTFVLRTLRTSNTYNTSILDVGGIGGLLDYTPYGLPCNEE